MKGIISIFFCLSFLYLNAQDKFPVIPHAEPGKVYATCIHPLDSSHKEERMLKVAFPQWQSITDTIFKTSENIQRVVVKSAATRWYFKHADRNCLSAQPSDCINLAYVDIAEQTRGIRFAENEQLKTVQVERLVRPASLEWVMPPFIPSTDNFTEVKPYESGEYRYFRDELNQTIYVYSKSNQWRTWQEVLCTCGGGHARATVSDVQEVLKQKGYYSGIIDNILGNSTKSALMRFQKKNGLPIGTLDFETLRALITVPQPDRKFQQLNEW